MSETFLMKLRELQPSQLFINSEKLSEVMKAIGPSRRGDFQPIPVKKIGDGVVITDGHTRAFAAHLAALEEAPVFWDEDDLDWEAYEICVEWCRQEGVLTVADLKDRVVGPEEYEILWLKRCEGMQQGLRSRRERSQSE